MRAQLQETIDQKFDPTDSNAASDVVEKALRLMEICARALRDDSNGMRMGRDNAVELGVALMETAQAMNLLPYHFTGAQSQQLFEELCK